MQKFIIHGSRGSFPTSGDDSVKYGGNTICFEILTNEFQIFIDAGTGFQNAHIREDKTKLILISHFHHDHIQGLLSNSGVFQTNNNFLLCSALTDAINASQSVNNYFGPPYFPPDVTSHLKNLEWWNFSDIIDFIEPKLHINFINLDHPGGAVGYSIENQKFKVSILLDNEFSTAQRDQLLHFVDGSNVVIWDGTYTDLEIVNKRGWGHSSIEEASRFYQYANIERIGICHHAPFRTDHEIDRLISGLGSGVEIGYDGLEFDL